MYDFQLWWSGLKADFILNFVEKDRWQFITTGLKNTLIITLFSLILGVVLGVVVAIVRSSYDKTHTEMQKGLKKFILSIFNTICKVYLTVIRGTPVVVQLMIMYYIIFASSRNSTLVAIIAFGINSGAYVAEIVRSGIMSINEGQFEAGRSLGFDYKSTMWHVILPQAFKNILPALANEFIVLLKETSVAGYVTIRDLTMGGNIIRAATYSPFMPLIAVALIYLVLVMFFTKLVGILERRLRKSER
jgi:ABC-type amino acid transport system permease subunit